MNLNKKDKIEIFENDISWIIILAMFLYGTRKIVQFAEAAELTENN